MDLAVARVVSPVNLAAYAGPAAAGRPAGVVSPTMIGAMFEPLGVRPGRLRQDRILDEARHTADPVHLVRVFGITESTATNYVHAAHPGRQSVIPR
jgi:hypothetical protein